ncbi:MAG: glycosyltransferase family 2 protein [Atopobiaceae bacterium]|jgi:glycosyltransferase involved in cell wall biosynthesis|nr:glycosyltransferase family 2 protein [Atopobiaceae bacterium]
MPTLSHDDPAPELWLVVPCYNEQEVLPITSRVLAGKMQALAGEGLISPSSRVLLVDDGSSDGTWDIVRALHEDRTAPGLFAGIRFAHNEGHQNALYAGLMHALDQGCDCAVSLDADLQDDVDAIDLMIDQHAHGSEIVYGVRDNRDTDTGFKRWSARSYYRLLERMGIEIVYDSADYRLMGRRSLAALSRYDEVNLFLRGIVPSLGFETSKVYYKRGARAAGESKYPLRKMIDFAIEGVTSFSVRPMRLIAKAGLFAVLVSFAILVYVIASVLANHVVSGWASTILSIWFIGGALMVSLGVTGEYVGKTYLESKRRPRYVIAEELDGGKPSPSR